MRLAAQLSDYIHAAFTGLWIQTQEPDEAEREILEQGRSQGWNIAVWDMARGLTVLGPGAAPPREPSGGDPLAALRALPSLAQPGGTSLLLLHNFHRFLNNPEIVQTTFMELIAGKQRRTFIIVLAPTVQVPLELEKLFVVLEHALPDRDQLESIARELASENPADLPAGRDLERVLDAAAGLTRYEAEGAFALSITRHNIIRPETIWELKSQALKKSGLLTLHEGNERFSDLGGLQNLKDFCRRALVGDKPVKPRGVLLLGRPAPARARSPRRSATKRAARRSRSMSARSTVRWLARPNRTCVRRCGSSTR